MRNLHKSNYLDMYEGVHADVVYTNRFDENSDLSTTYLGQTKMTRETKIKTEEKIPIHRTRLHFGKIIRWYRMSNSIDTSASKSYMSKAYYFDV